MKLSAEQVLNAMDGVAMVLDDQLIIRQVGQKNWDQFYQQNASSDETVHLSATEVIGKPFMSFIAGSDVRSTYHELFMRVVNDNLGAVSVEYRCDAPEFKREMRFSLSLIESGPKQRRLLYQSIQLSETPRARINLFSALVSPKSDADILTVCSICAKVSWPVGATPPNREWIEASDYYRRGGSEVELISHGMCESCFEKLMAH